MIDFLHKLLWNPKQQRLRALWRLGLHLVFCAILVIALCIPPAILLSLAQFNFTAYEQVIFGFPQAIGILAACTLSHIFIDRRGVPKQLNARRNAKELATGFALGGALMGAIFATAWIGGWVTIDGIGPTAEMNWLQLFAWQAVWFILMWLVGWNEEFFSRGIQMRNLAEGLRGLGTIPSTVLAVVISASLFGLLHASNDHATPFSILSITFAGILLSVAWIRTGRLAVAVGLHAGWNYFQGPFFGFAVSGHATQGNLFHVSTTDSGWITGGEFGPEAGLLGFTATIVGASIIAFWPNQSQVSYRRFWYQRCASLVHYRHPRRTRMEDKNIDALTTVIH